jgi:hypothetical protein
MKKLSQEEFIERVSKSHNYKYIYTNVDYKNGDTPVCVICPIHGEFWIKPELHLRGHGCPKCAKNGIKYTTETFIEKAKEIHKDKCIYTEVDYIDSKTPVTIICPIHGKFQQTPKKHLQGHGCPICGKLKKIEYAETKREEYKNNFIVKAELLYNFKYYYGDINYLNNNTKIKLICPEHGEFYVTPRKHLQGTECPICTKERIRKLYAYSLEEYIDAVNKIHNYKYDYHLIKEYINIICPVHGKFTTMADSHLRGHGCPQCANENNISENKIYEYLKHNISNEIEKQKTFKWLNGKSLDIYIPSMNIAIEYQGRQHFAPVSIYGGEEHFLKQKQRDINKYNECKEHNIKLFYFTKEKEIPNEYLDIIYTKEEELLKAINSYNNKT